MRLGIKRSVWTAVGAALASLVLVAGCNGSAASPSPSESTGAAADYTVIATTSVFADLAQLALGDNVTIETIIPAGVDVHTFEPSPADAQKLAGADLIVMNGLGLDEWALSLLEAAGKSEEDVLELAEGIDESNAWVYLEGEEHDEEEGEEHSEEEGEEHGHGGTDPHIWLDPKGAAIYVNRIAARVAAELPERAMAIESARDAGLAEIAALDEELRVGFTAVEASARKIVTFHDAFGYFARAYEIEIVGVAVEAPGQEPSAKEIAALIDAIKAAGVTSVFSEAQFPSKVLDQVAAETGATVLGNLYSDALGDAPANSYLGAMRANASAILASFK
ncbi:MAG: zinc ABC transporter substrate-binding protein [Chloroflexi bacterium]|jgi:ABC-type Zn uptake system ZnuABC Zn-binding protein ZnuA|nr:MAG: zinc ABC transporter substrate-binding protein [Chloroflexota bacterium]